jgi:Arc/MetJ family transcription regulator
VINGATSRWLALLGRGQASKDMKILVVRHEDEQTPAILMMYTVDVHHQLSLGGVVALTQIDIDEDALAEAMRLSGAKTKKDTVNLALREFTARYRRVAALDHYAALAAGWDFEGWERRRAAEKDPAT